MAKRPTPGSLKRVTAENLVGLGAERLAEILVSVAETRADLKRRLRMELAAEQGAAPLAAEVDKRLGAFETSRGQIAWRQRPAFIRDLDALRELIVVRLAAFDEAAAIDRLWRFMASAPQSVRRYRERNGELEGVFGRAAGDLGALLARTPLAAAAESLIDAITRNPAGWKSWLPSLLAQATRDFATEALRSMAERREGVPGWTAIVRHLADAAGDVGAYAATYSNESRAEPLAAAELGRRYLAAGLVQEAGEALARGSPKPDRRGRLATPDFNWETLWIGYLDAVDRKEEAQAVRWASFERTLSVERARAFVSRLDGFEDVEAEMRAFERASNHSEFEEGLTFLMGWPALAEAARMIESRPGDVSVGAEHAELWAAKLRRRFPKAASILLHSGAREALCRRDRKTSDRLSAEAQSINI